MAKHIHATRPRQKGKILKTTCLNHHVNRWVSGQKAKNTESTLRDSIYGTPELRCEPECPVMKQELTFAAVVTAPDRPQRPRPQDHLQPGEEYP